MGGGGKCTRNSLQLDLPVPGTRILSLCREGKFREGKGWNPHSAVTELGEGNFPSLSKDFPSPRESREKGRKKVRTKKEGRNYPPPHWFLTSAHWFLTSAHWFLTSAHWFLTSGSLRMWPTSRQPFYHPPSAILLVSLLGG